MGFKILLLSIALLGVARSPSANLNSQPEGCMSPTVLAASLKTIVNKDWNGIDETKVQSMWPVGLGGIDCNRGACKEIGRNDRVIDDKCQCCEVFMFDVRRNERGEPIGESLNSVVFYSSALTQPDILNHARTITEAMGLPKAQAMTIRVGPEQEFNWAVGPKQETITLLFSRLYHENHVWTAYFLLIRQPFL